MRSRSLLLAAILLVCVVGRGAYVLYLVHTNSVVTVHGDTPTYLGPARQLVDHGRFDSGGSPNEPEFLRTPGYPVFVAAVYGIFGKSNTAVLLAQVALSALTVFLTYLLAARIWSAPIGLLAALFTLLEPLQNATSATLLTESLAALLLIVTAAIGFVALTDDTPRPKLFALLGLVTACATLVRPVTYYLPLLLLAILVVRRARGRDRWRDLAKITVAFLVPIVVLIGGWQLRNHERVDSWQFSGIEAKNVYHYRAAGVVARTSHIPFAEAQHELSDRLGPRGKETQGAYYGRMYRAGIHILGAHPVDTIVVTLKGLWSELFSVRVKFFEYLRSHPASGALVTGAEALLVAFYALCAYGLVLAFRRGRAASAHVFVAGLALYILVASAGPEAMGGRGERFRAPIMPILILYAAFGAHALYSSVTKRRSKNEPATAEPSM
jgi:hypothetical protein